MNTFYYLKQNKIEAIETIRDKETAEQLLNQKLFDSAEEIPLPEGYKKDGLEIKVKTKPEKIQDNELTLEEYKADLKRQIISKYDGYVFGNIPFIQNSTVLNIDLNMDIKLFQKLKLIQEQITIGNKIPNTFLLESGELIACTEKQYTDLYSEVMQRLSSLKMDLHNIIENIDKETKVNKLADIETEIAIG